MSAVHISKIRIRFFIDLININFSKANRYYIILFIKFILILRTYRSEKALLKEEDGRGEKNSAWKIC
jgi:hypothetical protein